MRAAADQQRLLRQTNRFAKWMDQSIRLPGGFRIGVDGLVGLIPGVGDLVGLGLSSYPILQAHRAGVSRWHIARMSGNVLLETLIGSIPVVGDLFDFWFKANMRNVKILQQQLNHSRHSFKEATA